MVTQRKSVEKKEPHVRYFEAVGRRKTAVARVRLFAGKGNITVNDAPIEKYFTLARYSHAAVAPLRSLGLDKFSVHAKIKGGGVSAQAGAFRHGLSRALVLADPELKKRLRVLGFLTRDSRMVERKKYGLKKARRAPQWAKR